MRHDFAGSGNEEARMVKTVKNWRFLAGSRPKPVGRDPLRRETGDLAIN